MSKTIIFFTQTLGYTGSEIALYNLLASTQLPIKKILVAKTKGKLIIKLPTDIQCFIEEEYYKITYQKPKTIIQRIYERLLHELYIKRFKKQKRFLEYIHETIKADYWYINTIAMPDILRFAENNHIPSLLHLHELEILIEYYPIIDLERIIKYPQLIIACSQAAKQMVNTFGRKENVVVNYPCIDDIALKNYLGKQSSLKNQLNIPTNRFIWAMSGSINNNKNPLFYVQIVSEILKQRQDVHFVWFSNQITDYGISLYAKKYAESLGVAESISWVYADYSNYYELLLGIDALVLTSRRESFSLAVLEALLLKKPSITYRGVGGTTEIVGIDNVLVVDDYTINSFVKIMLYVMDNYQNIKINDDLVRFSKEKAVQIWDNIIAKFINNH